MPDWKKWGRRALSVGLAPVTGGASLVGLAPDIPGINKLDDILLGQKPGDVKLPPGYQEARDRRAGFINDLQSQLGNTLPTETDLERAVGMQAQDAMDQSLAQQAAMAASGRGFGAVAARSQAQQQGALAQTGIASQAATARMQARAQEQARLDQERARREGMLADMFGQDLQLSMAEEEFRRNNAKPGMLGSLLGIGGAAIGGALGGPQGGQAGGQLGYGLGTAAQSAFR